MDIAEIVRGKTTRKKSEAHTFFGDSLFLPIVFTVVYFLRFRGENCEDVVNRASDKFDRRYRAVEAKLAAEGKTVDDTPPDRLDELWNEAKSEEDKN